MSIQFFQRFHCVHTEHIEEFHGFVCVCVCVRACVCACVLVWVGVGVSAHACGSVHMCLCMCACVHVWVLCVWLHGYDSWPFLSAVVLSCFL